MSDPAPTLACSSCPAALEPAELISDGTCRTCLRYSRATLALLLVNLLVTVVFGLLGVVRDDSSTKPGPKPSPTATATPSPSAPTPSDGSTPTPMPTPTMSPDPTDGACNIFDPECNSGATGGNSGGTEA